MLKTWELTLKSLKLDFDTLIYDQNSFQSSDDSRSRCTKLGNEHCPCELLLVFIFGCNVEKKIRKRKENEKKMKKEEVDDDVRHDWWR